MDKMGEGVVVLVIGMTIVFSVLILLWAILLGFEKVFSKTPKKKPVQEKKAAVTKPVAPAVVEKTDDESELVAVITAAISAMTGMSASKFKIKSIKRISNWNK